MHADIEELKSKNTSEMKEVQMQLQESKNTLNRQYEGEATKLKDSLSSLQAGMDGMDGMKSAYTKEIE